MPNPVIRNVAWLRPAFQVSTYEGDKYGPHPARLANDGSRQTNFNVKANGCAASNIETNPWWAVDLGVPTIVYYVNLTNRGDGHGSCLKLNYNLVPPKKRLRGSSFNRIIYKLTYLLR